MSLLKAIKMTQLQNGGVLMDFLGVKNPSVVKIKSFIILRDMPVSE